MSTVLVVENDWSLRNALTLIFSEEGHVVVSAANEDEAVPLIERNKIDVVISDLMMNKPLGGLQVVRAAVARGKRAMLYTAHSSLLEGESVPEKCAVLEKGRDTTTALQQLTRAAEDPRKGIGSSSPFDMGGSVGSSSYTQAGQKDSADRALKRYSLAWSDYGGLAIALAIIYINLVELFGESNGAVYLWVVLVGGVMVGLLLLVEVLVGITNE